MKRLIFALLIAALPGVAFAQSQNNGNSALAPTGQNIPSMGYNYLWNGSGWDQGRGLLTGTAGAPGADVVSVQSPGVGGAYPAAATPITGNATGTTSAVVGTLAANATKTTYICDFDISAIGGTAAVGPITVAGLLGGSKVYQLTSTAAGVFLTKSFNPCIPASAINTAITVTTTADGTATAVDVNSSGYQQ